MREALGVGASGRDAGPRCDEKVFQGRDLLLHVGRPGHRPPELSGVRGHANLFCEHRLLLRPPFPEVLIDRGNDRPGDVRRDGLPSRLLRRGQFIEVPDFVPLGLREEGGVGDRSQTQICWGGERVVELIHQPGVGGTGGGCSF